jgi:hypothetical protein
LVDIAARKSVAGYDLLLHPLLVVSIDSEPLGAEFLNPEHNGTEALQSSSMVRRHTERNHAGAALRGRRLHQVGSEQAEIRVGNSGLI